ncbi:DUF4190 domain-containing protein [Streptomyces varsoviensis]|uniref:DUF4190 domain-containing protein n=1 Tax=Streptomyces varsoviensis TaxID=67373 RepID=A0ABR5J028_9ACTN|nr:DUF4190 domain-containing protein [Streptomyces varsoviensis]KOG86760.1 hypothetical protein ADK38_29235 [Streptomyces varsoviensis]
MTVSAPVRTTHPDTTAPADSATAAPAEPADRRRPRRNDADSMAVASFVLGLVGLLVFNLVLGPCALVLGTLALARSTGRRGRAWLGLALGAADLIVLAALVTADGTVSWSVGG